MNKIRYILNHVDGRIATIELAFQAREGVAPEDHICDFEYHLLPPVFQATLNDFTEKQGFSVANWHIIVTDEPTFPDCFTTVFIKSWNADVQQVKHESPDSVVLAS